MNELELIFLALGLSMDAFAVAVGLGLTMPKANSWKAFVVGGYFGVFQGVMPVIGYFAATFFARYVTAVSHWISFALLVLLGAKMIFDSFKKSDDTKATSLAPRIMIPLALATSVDAMAVGVSFAFLYVQIFLAVPVIAAVTFVISVSGVQIGGIFGAKFKNKAAFAGGVILILIGINILRGGL
ncbi:MAG: manganese efflux pump MntP family protein [Defluviitaleaceae bacterium]|nr:manganese efflux pump MntP family protein [Defluviitaleaceae bacterium]